MPIPTHYEIRHACGHTVTRDLSAKLPLERAGLVTWLTARPCRACDPTEKARTRRWLAEKHPQAEAAANATEQRFRLDPLTGPDKIRSWATEVRATIVQDAWETLGDALGEDSLAATIAGPASRLSAAGWWIDHREISIADLTGALAEALGDDAAVSAGNDHPFS